MLSSFTNLSNLKKFVVDTTASITYSDTVQNVKERVASIPVQTKEYFYPTPEQHELRSVVRLDDAFFVQRDIEEYITPGQAAKPNGNVLSVDDAVRTVKPSGDAHRITSWHDFELCVEDEALFDETEIGSYTTTNYSVTTAATSILTPQYNLHPKQQQHPHQHQPRKSAVHVAAQPVMHLRKSTLTQHDHELEMMESASQTHHEHNNHPPHNARATVIYKHDDRGDDEHKHNADIENMNELNLDEEDAERLFKNLHSFRKSIIDRRRASGVDNHDGNRVEEQTTFSAPPTSKSSSSYHRRLHTLDLDEAEDELKMGLCVDSGDTASTASAHHPVERKADEENIAAPHNASLANTAALAPQPQYAVEGSRELGIDEVELIHHLTEPSDSLTNDDDDDHARDHDLAQLDLELEHEHEHKGHVQQNKSLLTGDMLKGAEHGRTSSIKWVMSHDPENAQLFASGHIMNGSPDDDDDVKQISSSKDDLYGGDGAHAHGNGALHFEVEFRADEAALQDDREYLDDDDDDDGSDDDLKESEFMKLKNQFSVERNLNGPRGSMKVTRISVSDEVRQTLMYQKSITDAARPLAAAAAANEASPETSSSSIDNQFEMNDYVKRVSSTTPRGDHAKVSVVQYRDTPECLQSNNFNFPRQHSESIEAEPDHNAQAPYFEHGQQQDHTNEGFERPTGHPAQHSNRSLDDEHRHDEEKYDDDAMAEDDDGYGATTTRDGAFTTMGGGVADHLNALGFIPWRENEYLPQELDESYDERMVPRFSVNRSLNEIIRFHWNGDALLQCDAVVIPITENWTPISQESHMLMNNAGSRYLEFVHQTKKMGAYVSTGDVLVCDAYNLPTKYIIHTTPPRYDDRYPVASENAMNSCVWRSLEIAADLQCETIVFPSIFPPNFYSEQLAIHILSRTLRRFLERYHETVAFTSVVACVDNEQQMQLFTRIFTIYFPRDAIDLKYSQKYIPAYTGNHCGGSVVKLRKHRIELSPLTQLLQSAVPAGRGAGAAHQRVQVIHRHGARVVVDYDTYDIYGNLRPAIRQMVQFTAEPEVLWTQQESKKWSWQKMEESFQLKYKRYWNRCRKINLRHIQLSQFLYVGGQDRDGRDILIFVGNRFPSKQLMQQKQLKQSLLYVIREIHHLVERDYIILYLHSYVDEESLPPVAWINQCFQICANRFHKNLHSFFVVHPNFRLKSWFYVLSTKTFYRKIVYLDSITKLEHYNIDLEHIAIPGKAWEYEREMFGEKILADKMALASDDLVLDALPYR